MSTPGESIAAYIRAKDGNRPHLLDISFETDAILKMLVRTEAISFPSASKGRDAIAETLVRRFNQTYENIYTLCIAEPPKSDVTSFSCEWLVVMSEKQDGTVRVGCGRYDWSFEETQHKVLGLTITIEAMEVLPPENLAAVMSWISSLPYPWCSQRVANNRSPNIASVQHVLQILSGGIPNTNTLIS